jgi:hypothetical protein
MTRLHHDQGENPSLLLRHSTYMFIARFKYAAGDSGKQWPGSQTPGTAHAPLFIWPTSQQGSITRRSWVQLPLEAQLSPRFCFGHTAPSSGMCALWKQCSVAYLDVRTARPRGVGPDDRHLVVLFIRSHGLSGHPSRPFVKLHWSNAWDRCVYVESDRLCGLVVRVPGYRSRSPGFDSRRYQSFWEVVGLERGPVSLVGTIEELLGRKSSDSGVENRDYGRSGSSALTTWH